jgi:hypothetical protein
MGMINLCITYFTYCLPTDSSKLVQTLLSFLFVEEGLDKRKGWRERTGEKEDKDKKMEDWR